MTTNGCIEHKAIPGDVEYWPNAHEDDPHLINWALDWLAERGQLPTLICIGTANLLDLEWRVTLHSRISQPSGFYPTKAEALLRAVLEVAE